MRESRRAQPAGRAARAVLAIAELDLEAPDERSPWLELRHDVDDDGKATITVALAWRDEVHEQLAPAGNDHGRNHAVEVVRQFFPQMEEPVSAPAPMPHARVRQITGSE